MPANLQKIVDLAYSAAVEDVLWRDWTLELIKEFQTPGALFWVIDAERFDMCQNHMCFPDADSERAAREYMEEWVQYDPQMTRVCNSKRSEIYLDTDHVDLNSPTVAAYTRWQESIVGTCHHITSSVVLADGLEAGVSLHFSREHGPADAATRRQIGSLFPQFARALQLGYRHSEAISENWWDGISAIGDQPKVLLDPNGKVLRANSAAEAIFARCDGLRISCDRLACDDAASEERLSAAVITACERQNPKAASVAIRRKGGALALPAKSVPPGSKASVPSPVRRECAREHHRSFGMAEGADRRTKGSARTYGERGPASYAYPEWAFCGQCSGSFGNRLQHRSHSPFCPFPQDRDIAAERSCSIPRQAVVKRSAMGRFRTVRFWQLRQPKAPFRKRAIPIA